MRLERLKIDHFTMIVPWFDDPETARRLGGFYPVREHLYEQITKPDKYAWLLWEGNTPVGLVELEKENEIANILILVAPDRRGEGLGHKLVEALPPLAKNIGTQTLRAYIATDAVASQRCFQTAGFVATGNKKGFSCYDLLV